MEAPAHPFLKRLDLRQRRSRNNRQSDIPRRKVHHAAANMVGNVGTAWAAFLPFRPEHEVINDQLTLAAEEVDERLLSARPVENILLLYSFPRQFTALSAQFIAQPCELFFLFQQLLPGGKPFCRRYHFRLFYR